MNLEFKINGKTIERANIQVLASKSSKCFFTFSQEWVSLEKYIIFWTKKNKKIIRYLGKGERCHCDIPPKIIGDNIFSIQAYANKDFTTQKLQIGGIPEGYTITPPICKGKKTYKNSDSEMLLYYAFSSLDSKIDNIKYNDGFLKCYSNKKLKCKIPIFRDLRQEIQNNIKELMPYFELNENGDFYVIYPYKKEIN